MTQPETCERLDFCIFIISGIQKESILNRYKARYCLSCKAACAIYMIATTKGEGAVPGDLYPNEYDRALEILSSES